jgi:formylglycine-generating enzyme required for sulfatase activity
VDFAHIYHYSDKLAGYQNKIKDGLITELELKDYFQCLMLRELVKANVYSSSADQAKENMWGEFLNVNYPKIIYQGFDFIANVLTGDSTEDAIANLNYLSNESIKAANDIRASTFDHWIIQEDYSNFIRWLNSIDAADKTFTNTIGMEFVLIPGGEFEMGSPPDEEARFEEEGPVHHVNIGKAFYMGRYEVTQQQWRAIMSDNPSYFTGDDDLPVEQVSWDDVQEFIKKLNEKEGTDKYRLPSEAEWEYACRAGTATRYSLGDDESKLGDYAWYADNSDWKTHPVGQKKPNPWGLYDMHGNVWEWVQDCWHSDYNGAPTDGSAWVVACKYAGADRVFLGGSWLYYARFCRSASRYHLAPGGFRPSNLGFRILREQ